jgi:hypothetical protein
MRRRQGELGVKQTRIKPELVGLGLVAEDVQDAQTTG